jgi:hypothetical protein
MHTYPWRDSNVLLTLRVAGTKGVLECNESFIELIIGLRFAECVPVLVVQQAG